MMGDPEIIIKTLAELKEHRDLIEEQLFDIVVYLPNGGATISEVWMLSPKQRNTLVKKINKYNKQKYGNEDDNYIVNRGQA